MIQLNYVKTGLAAKHFGVSHKTLERWRHAGKIDAINPTGGCWYYSIPSLEYKTQNKTSCMLESELDKLYTQYDNHWNNTMIPSIHPNWKKPSFL